MAQPIADIARTPFHYNKGRPCNWNAEPEMLELLDTLTHPGMDTAETGAGASTVVFAAAGCQHVAVSPHVHEHQAIIDYCRTRGIDTARITLTAGRSQDILPTIGTIQLGFIDGAHRFPFPVMDYYYLSRRLDVGGVLVFDDAPIPSVGMVCQHLQHDAAWETIAVAGDRAVAFRKIAEHAPGDPWGRQWINRRYPQYAFLPTSRRMVLHARRIRRPQLRGRRRSSR